jgi:hypothetical protein
MGEITYNDIKRQFSEEDLRAYDLLCMEFVKLRGNKNNAELWDLVKYESQLRIILDTIHIIREKYDFLKGVIFFNVWRYNPKTAQKEEISW